LDGQFDAARAYYRALSQSFGSCTPNAVASIVYSGIEVTCSDPNATRVCVNIDPAMMAQSTWWTPTNCNFDADYIVNIIGTGNVTFTGGSFSSISERTIYNIQGNRWVFVGATEVRGNILAPDAQYYQDGGVVYGNVIVGNIVRMLQINRLRCHLFLDVLLQTFLEESPAQRKRSTACNNLIFVASFGEFVKGDSITLEPGTSRAETLAITDLVNYSPGNIAFQVSPAPQFTHPAGSAVVATVGNAINATRTAQTPVNYNGNCVPQTSTTGGTGNNNESAASMTQWSFFMLLAMFYVTLM
jgi:hypothetical protein